MSKLKAGFFGCGGNSFLVSEVLKDTIESAGYEIVLCTEWDNATDRWTRDGWKEVMNKCDVILCPQRVEVQPAKSSIKATTAMMLSMPVICSPLQAYKEIIKHGENGFICDTNEEWADALSKLKDPETRKRIGEAGKKTAEAFSLDNISKEWIKVLTDLISSKLTFKEIKQVEQVPDRPLVDIIIASYNNVEYLKLCINSILVNTDYPYHIIISDGGSGKETWEYLKTLHGITVIGEEGKRLNYSETCNAGIAQSGTKYFVICNSDVIISKGWLTNLVDKMNTKGRLAACNGLSNCDRGWLFDNPRNPGSPSYPMRLEKAGIELVPGMKMDAIKPHMDELYSFMAQSNVKHKDGFTVQPWIAVYATIFAKSAVDEVGRFDTRFKNGCEDLDLCIRLANFGYTLGQSIDAFVFHFGGISRAAYEKENNEEYHKEDRFNHAMLYNKWKYTEPVSLDTPMEYHYKNPPSIVDPNGRKKRIVIYTGSAWEPWDKAKVDAGMAGSETWAAYLAREFVKKGYRTTIYNSLKSPKDAIKDPVEDFSGKEIGSVLYRDHTQMLEDLKYDTVDYFISSRTVEPFKHNVHSLTSWVMIHDIFISADRSYDVMSWRIHGYAYLSEWHREFLLQHHTALPPNKMFPTANGVDMTTYADVDQYEKRNMTVWGSSPDRGLYQFLIQIFPRIRKEVPDFEVVVAYGFFNWESACKVRNDVQSLELIKKIKEAMDQPGVKYVDRVSKKVLADYQKQSKVWLFSSWFSETFCINASSSGVAKCALVCTDFAGLKTTVGDSGILIPNENLTRDNLYPESYVDRFVLESVKLLKDESYRKMWADKAYNKMKMYDWGIIADGWIKQFKR